MIQVVNLIIVFSLDRNHVLMCRRQKDPYKGRYNFVGGKAYPEEGGLDAAYRELEEETGITKQAIVIECLFKTYYPDDSLELQVYYGTLTQEVVLEEEINPLLWISTKQKFDDDAIFAGNGNIQHMMHILKEKYNIV